ADSEDTIDDSKNLAFLSSKAHPSFKKDDESLRKYDYGVVVLEKALDIEPLELTDEQLAKDTPITIVGYGQKAMVHNGRLTERPNFDLKKRAFKSTITEIQNEDRIYYTHINPETAENFVFPYEGDSGGPVFRTAQEHSGVILGIVSGFVNEEAKAAYINPTIKNIAALLDE
ncbi:MAG: serine protease, partial [Alphaproteobacteria bacterium]|nr:serine protease [Alphaproteobacteria bacterium]